MTNDDELATLDLSPVFTWLHQRSGGQMQAEEVMSSMAWIANEMATIGVEASAWQMQIGRSDFPKERQLREPAVVWQTSYGITIGNRQYQRGVGVLIQDADDAVRESMENPNLVPVRQTLHYRAPMDDSVLSQFQQLVGACVAKARSDNLASKTPTAGAGRKQPGRL